MVTATSTPPTSDVLPPEGEAAPRRVAPRKSSWLGKAIILALFAGVTVGALILGGVFDSSSSDIKIDPVSNKPATATSTAPRAADAEVVVEYVAAMKTWNECMAKHATDGATDKCGAMPEQVDSPALNAYLAEVLNWNKCAAPLLKKNALAQAEAACGPSPAVPTGE